MANRKSENGLAAKRTRDSKRPLQHTIYHAMPPLKVSEHVKLQFPAEKPYYSGELSYWKGFSEWVTDWDQQANTQTAFTRVENDETKASTVTEDNSEDIHKTAIVDDTKKAFTLVGDVSSCVTAKLHTMVDAAKGEAAQCNTLPLRTVLGHIVHCMIEHKTTHAFLSNYDYTVFLMLSFPEEDITQSVPHLYFSDAISYQNGYHLRPRPLSSVRLGLLYLLYQCPLGREVWDKHGAKLAQARHWLSPVEKEIPSKYTFRMGESASAVVLQSSMDGDKEEGEEKDEHDIRGTHLGPPTPLHRLIAGTTTPQYGTTVNGNYSTAGTQSGFYYS
ncbi:hypothetical protein M011DRAFT_455285 [Sporormia fimetaria CBS 119925]|uniref:Uncharacterized protein n=1 Tax=Sporormia fimetaria CBS 119925 TaxID=1340428 RepID=A0A6A6VND1_9PLEO|nr:hypothetical protein M011DRAFT_455285 [Sporormia fimetaria CBS 119925]